MNWIYKLINIYQKNVCSHEWEKVKVKGSIIWEDNSREPFWYKGETVCCKKCKVLK